MSKKVNRFLAPLDGGFVEAVEAREYDALLAEQDALKKDAGRASAAFNAVVTYILGEGYMESPMEFLRCWNEGAFDSLREEWPEAPQAIYYADSLADHEAIDAALATQGGN